MLSFSVWKLVSFALFRFECRTKLLLAQKFLLSIIWPVCLCLKRQNMQVFGKKLRKWATEQKARSTFTSLKQNSRTTCCLSLSLSSQNTDKKETSSVSFLVLACTCWNERHGFVQRVSPIDHCDVSIPVGDSQAARNIAALSLQPYRFENWFLINYQSLLI